MSVRKEKALDSALRTCRGKFQTLIDGSEELKELQGELWGEGGRVLVGYGNYHGQYIDIMKEIGEGRLARLNKSFNPILGSSSEVNFRVEFFDGEDRFSIEMPNPEYVLEGSEPVMVELEIGGRWITAPADKDFFSLFRQVVREVKDRLGEKR